MYRIGEFSYLCECTIKTLRHYDKIGILKPKEIDNFTGYRYYSEEQLNTYHKIRLLPNAGFTLKEIKSILDNPKDSNILEEIKKLTNDYQEKLIKLEEIKNKLRGNIHMELIKNPKFVMLGEYKELKARNDLKKELERIDKKVDNKMFSELPSVLISYEVGFKENDVTCFIGRVLDEDLKMNYEFIKQMESVGLETITNNKPETMLYTSSNNMIESYKEMIKYANKNNIQIRGEFIEIYDNDKIDIYVEAYDLTKDNEDAKLHAKQLQEKFNSTKPIYDAKYIGKWILQGQIVEPLKIFNPNKEHFMPDTKFKELTSKADGTTNYDNVTWRDGYLLIETNNIAIDNPIGQENSQDGTRYLGIMMKDENINARPCLYYYKEEK